MAEAKGIKETKEVMEFIFSFVDAIGKAKADDKFSWTDARYFIDPVKKLFEAVDNIEEVIPEIVDIDDKEYDELRPPSSLPQCRSLLPLYFSCGLTSMGRFCSIVRVIVNMTSVAALLWVVICTTLLRFIAA